MIIGTKIIQPGDIILFEDNAAGHYGKLKRWLMNSEYGHGAIYVRDGYICEAIGKAVCRRYLYNTEHRGRNIMVLRLKRYLDPDREYAGKAAREAELIADHPLSNYDFLGIVRFVIPRLILYRLTGKVFSLGYRNNSLYYCFELIARVYILAMMPVISNSIAMASDFIASQKLDLVYAGKLDW